MKEITQETIGKLLHGQHERDAIHIAVMPVIARCRLSPGDPICLVGDHGAVIAGDGGHIGIVDPYIPGALTEGDQFWMFLLPNTITGLRHQWTHPGIDSTPDSKSESEQWIQAFSARWNLNYRDLIHEASQPQGAWPTGPYRYITADGIDLHSSGDLGDDHDLFWRHLEVVTSQRFDEAHRGKFVWSCSC